MRNMRNLLAKVLSKSIEKEQEISICHSLEDPTEVACEKGTTFEIDENYLFLEEHYSLWNDSGDHSKGKEEHVVFHLFRIADIQYIGAA